MIFDLNKIILRMMLFYHIFLRPEHVSVDGIWHLDIKVIACYRLQLKKTPVVF